MRATLHYIFDPLCGWCYAAAPLLGAVQQQFGDQLDIRLGPGLLFEQPKALEQDWREHIIEADARIHKLTGVPFGAAYIARVRNPAPMVLHSVLPAAAVLASKTPLAMLEAIQRAHYVDGLDVCDEARLVALAVATGDESAQFARSLSAQLIQLPTVANEARSLLQASGGRGFPTFVLEQASQHWRVDHASAYGQPELFVQQLTHLLKEKTA